MMNRCSLLLLALVAASLGLRAQQADFSKMSGFVRQAAVAGQQRSHRGPARTQSQHTMTAFVRADDALTDDALAGLGCRRHAHVGDISIVSVPIERLPELSVHPAVKRIEAGQSAHVLMDTVPSVIHALPAYTATASHPAFTGSGVVLGLMDVGFDLTHPNFYTDQTATQYRIGALWDQLSPDTIGSTLPVGRDFVGHAEVLAQAHSTDGPTQTHGTHTLGIAAGSGYDSPYRGMAFGSDLCLVSNAVTDDTLYIAPDDLYKYTTATDALGFKYLFDYADSQGKPCVVSFSEGYHQWADEEDELFSAFVDQLCGPGHIIVVAAGNESLWNTYAEKPAGVGEAGAFMRIYSKSAYYRVQSDGPMQLHLYAYANGGGEPTDTLTISSADQRLDSLLTDTFTVAGEPCRVTALRYPSTLSADTIYVLQLSADRSISGLAPVALTATGTDSRVQIFATASCPLDNKEAVDARWNAAAGGHNILAPACFPSAICVGSTSHRLGFTNYLGEYRDFSTGREAGKRTPASSMGPTMDGRLKPDVMAPGDNIISSYSSYYLEANPTASDIRSDVAHFDFNGRTYAWNSNAGTSMACPVVAGTIALWLQARPDLTRQDVMDIFSRTCRQPDAALPYPNPQYGYGEIDAYRGLLDILGISKVEAISTHQPATVAIALHDGQLHLTFAASPSATPVQVSLYSMSGTLVYQSAVLPTAQHVTLALPALAPALYAVQLTSADPRLTGSQLVRN